MSNNNQFWLGKIIAFWGILIVSAIPSSTVLSQNDRVSDYSQNLERESLTCFSYNSIDSKSITKPSGIDGSIPYVVSPRNTFIDTNRPKLRWNKVKGATSYTVKIVRNSEIVWEKTVEQPETNISNKLPLESGVDYSLIVESDNGHSSKMDLDVSSISFQLLDKDKIKSLANDEKKITDLELTDDEEALELAHLYFGKKYGLVAKATELLEERIAAGSQTSEIYVTLGNLYQVGGLYDLAEARYRTALDLAKPKQELEEQIIAKAGLAQILTSMGNEEEANRLMQERASNIKALSNKSQSKPRRINFSRFGCDCTDDRGIPGIRISLLCRRLLCIPG